MKIAVKSIKILKRIRKDVRNVSALADNIAKNGLISPIAVMETTGGEFQLLAGLRRVRAAQSLGWTEIEANVMSAKDAEAELNIEISENEQREEFTHAEKLDYAKQIERLEAVKANERMQAGQKIENDNPRDTCPGGRARDIAGEKIGLSGRQFDRLKYIGENAPEVLKDLDSGAKTIGKVYKELRAVEKAEKAKTEPAFSVKSDDTVADIAVDVAVFDMSGDNIAEETEDESVSADVVGEALNDAAFSDEAPPETAPEDGPPPEPTPEPAPKKSGRKTAAQKHEEAAMAALSPKDREAALKLTAFAAMTDKEKVVELERQLMEERSRAARAETALAKEKDLHFNDNYHQTGTIERQEKQIEQMTAALTGLRADLEETQAALDEVCRERDELKAELASVKAL